MTEESESYMRGWQSGYHNATLAERERIIKLLKDTFGTLGIQRQVGSYVFATDLEALIKGEQE
jgi:hypothetical protein